MQVQSRTTDCVNHWRGTLSSAGTTVDRIRVCYWRLKISRLESPVRPQPVNCQIPNSHLPGVPEDDSLWNRRADKRNDDVAKYVIPPWYERARRVKATLTPLPAEMDTRTVLLLHVNCRHDDRTRDSPRGPSSPNPQARETVTTWIARTLRFLRTGGNVTTSTTA